MHILFLKVYVWRAPCASSFTGDSNMYNSHGKEVPAPCTPFVSMANAYVENRLILTDASTAFLQPAIYFEQINK